MELDRVKAKINKISKENNIDVQAAWDILFFDEFLERLSKSEYKNRFVLKGGFYLQSIVGINNRYERTLPGRCHAGCGRRLSADCRCHPCRHHPLFGSQLRGPDRHLHTLRDRMYIRMEHRRHGRGPCRDRGGHLHGDGDQQLRMYRRGLLCGSSGRKLRHYGLQHLLRSPRW